MPKKPKAARPEARLDPRFEGRAAKQEEERLLRERRARQLAGAKSLEWRGMDLMGVPESIRRTPWVKEEPSLHQKLNDILGEAGEKEGRAKNKDKSRRQGGR